MPEKTIKATLRRSYVLGGGDTVPRRVGPGQVELSESEAKALGVVADDGAEVPRSVTTADLGGDSEQVKATAERMGWELAEADAAASKAEKQSEKAESAAAKKSARKAAAKSGAKRAARKRG